MTRHEWLLKRREELAEKIANQLTSVHDSHIEREKLTVLNREYDETQLEICKIEGRRYHGPDLTLS